VTWSSGIIFAVDVHGPACFVPEPVGLAECEQPAIRIQLSKQLQRRQADSSSAVSMTDLDELNLYEVTWVYVTEVLPRMGALDHLDPSEFSAALVMNSEQRRDPLEHAGAPPLLVEASVVAEAVRSLDQGQVHRAILPLGRPAAGPD
jgi:hypothetical protein